MHVDYLAVGGTIQEATRPRKSGVVKNAHATRQSLEPLPDYQKMLDVVEGRKGTSTEDDVSDHDEQR